MGARADGWWRDRAGAALRLGREVMALARQSSGAQSGGALSGRAPAGAWVLVLEGRARDAAAILQDEADEADEAVPVRVVSAPGSGDDAIVGVVAEVVARDES